MALPHPTSGIRAGGAVARPGVLLGSLVAVMTLVTVVSSLGAPLIPSISRQDHVPLSTGEWLLTAPLVAGALSTPLMGRLADGARQRRVVVLALSCVIVGCLVAAVSTEFVTVVVGRALQGLGLGLTPVTMAIARRHLPPAKVGPAITTISATSSIGVGIGYPVTSLLAQAFSVEAAFWLGVGMGVCALVLTLAVIPTGGEVRHRPFDIPGAATLALAVVGVCLVLSEGGHWGWTSPAALSCALATVAIGAAWVLYELRQRDPLVDLRQIRNRMVLTADLSGLMISTCMYLYVPPVIAYCQIPRSVGYGLGTSVLVAGLVLTPLSVTTFVASRSLPSFERRFGSRLLIPLGSLIFAVSTVSFGLWHGALWEAFASVGFAGFGLGFTYAAMPGFIIRAVPHEETGSATGFYGVLRSIGLSLGSALAAAVLVASTPRGHSLPSEHGFTVALLAAGGVCVFTAAASFLLPGRSKAATAGGARPLDGVRRGVLGRPEPALETVLVVDDPAGDARIG